MFLSELFICNVGTQRLHNLGARKIVVFDVPPAGCLPAVLNAIGSPGPCVETVNRIIALYNEELPKLLSNLSSELEGSKFVLGTTFNTSLDMNLNPSKYGQALFINNYIT